jgi:hypothetical protein
MDKMIPQFKSFLSEATLYEDYLMEAALSGGLSNDDKGKLHELLLAKYLHPDKKLPEHFRAEGPEAEEKGHAGSPQGVHDKLMNKVGPDAYKEIDSHAQKTAKALTDDLKARGITSDKVKIGGVHWTSNRDRPGAKGDHEKLTGVKDTNSNADLILSLHDKNGKIMDYHGVSAKYGANEKPNYKNPGMDSLENMAGLRKGRISEIMKPHHKYMENLGYHGTIDERHAQYKLDKMPIKDVMDLHQQLKAKIKKGEKLKPDEVAMSKHIPTFVNAYNSQKDTESKKQFLYQAKARADEADKSKREHLGMIGKELSKSLIEKTKDDGKGSADAALREQIRNDVSPKTVIPHSVAHSWVQDSGEAKPVIHDMHHIADQHLDKFERLHVATDRAGAVVIRGYDKDTGERKNVATYGLKTQSGPHKNINGTLQLG